MIAFSLVFQHMVKVRVLKYTNAKWLDGAGIGRGVSTVVYGVSIHGVTLASRIVNLCTPLAYRRHARNHFYIAAGVLQAKLLTSRADIAQKGRIQSVDIILMLSID